MADITQNQVIAKLEIINNLKLLRTEIPVTPVRLSINGRDITPITSVPITPVRLNIIGRKIPSEVLISDPKTLKGEKIKKYTLEIFLERAYRIHGDKFDYSAIIPEHVRGCASHLPIKCKACGHEWSPTISQHINYGQGCPDCAGIIKYTYERFMNRAQKVHGDKFDYGTITPEHITGANAHVPIRCKTCGYRWSPTISHHINDKTGCPDCLGHIPYTYDLFMKRAAEVHGDKFDYSAVTPEHIKGNTSTIPVKCRTCNYQWTPLINNHITAGQGCPDCKGYARWTYERVIKRSKEIHGDRYNYEEVTPDHIDNANSRIPVSCQEYGHRWTPTINDHINGRHGCPRCKKSKGERACADILTDLSIPFRMEVIHSFMPNRKYDFEFEYNGSTWFLEFDGEFHFIRCKLYDPDLNAFEERQGRDIEKTEAILRNGHKLIRIDYTKYDSIKEHIVKALSENKNLYLSDSVLYFYITEALPLGIKT